MVATEGAKEITAMVLEKESDEFSLRFQRMDEDEAVWDMTPEVISPQEAAIQKLTKSHASDIKIISNDLRTFCDDVQSTLASAEMQIMVRMAEAEGEDKRDDIGKLERLFYFLLFKADERLRRLLLPPLRDQLIWFALVRGWAAGRFMTYSGKDGSVIPDYMAYDPRWLTYDVGREGLMWTAHKTFKTGAALLSMYDYKSGVEKDNAVIDYWKRVGDGKFANSIVTEGVYLKNPVTYEIPSFPVLIMPVATRPPIVDTSWKKERGYGDSLFAANRNVNAVRNKFATIVASHANLMANQGLINYKSKNGASIDSTTNVPGGVVELVMGENKLEASPMQEISPTVVSMMGFLDGQMAQGMLIRHPRETPTSSGTRYALEQEASNMVFNPQLRNMNNFFSDICHLVEEQLIVGGIGDKKITSVNVQWQEKQKYFETKVKPVDLKKPHTIRVEFTAKTPWTQMDTAQVAQMLKQLGLPDGWIWENILKVQDPKGLADLAAIELFEHSPKGAMKRAIEALIETRGDIQAAQSLVEDLDKLEAQE
ncbi:hypothetical protein LCGC14_1617830, partial [marine sediment metagenome]